MQNLPHFTRGDFVTLSYQGRSIKAMVMLASPNSKSLMLGFDGALWGDLGMHVGAMAVLQDDDGVYRDLVEGLQVLIEPLRSQSAPVDMQEYRERTAKLQPHYECPRCGAISYNRNDIEQGYCGRCKAWTRQ